jgi:hypothetical protein
MIFFGTIFYFVLLFKLIDILFYSAIYFIFFPVIFSGYVIVGKRGDAPLKVDNSEHCLVQNLEQSPKIANFIKDVSLMFGFFFHFLTSFFFIINTLYRIWELKRTNKYSRKLK